MGYTHYFTQRRDIGRRAWEQHGDESGIAADLAAIIRHAENVQGVALRGPSGETPGAPTVGDEEIAFNGAGEDAHESFHVRRIRAPLEPWQTPDRRGWDFCKTARKPYDVAVTACLCYLATVAETHTVSSDGSGRDWLAGLELARQALPRYANRLDIPRGILEDDRWCPPFPSLYCARYEFNFCVDGRAYIMGPGGKSYRFHSHHEAAAWAATWTERQIYVESSFGRRWEGDAPLFSPSGAFNDKRNKALGRQQSAALRQMLERATGDRATPPPALVRPGDMPAIDETPRAYSLEALLAMADA